MRNGKIGKKLMVALLIPLGTFLVGVFSKKPLLVERFYSEGIYRYIAYVIGKVSGIFPFSVAELAVILLVVVFIIYTTSALIKSFFRQPADFFPFVRYLADIVAAISIAFFLFLTVWGFNYYRMPFAEIAGMEVKPASVNELESLCKSLIEKANDLRSSVNTDEGGNMVIPGSRRHILNNCYKGYEAILDDFPFLGGSYGNPKPFMLSNLINYMGICGVYFPFTGEANVNISIPDSIIPSSASHEMAHQRGFSREDEANYISYLACTAHPDVNFNYSGILLALTNSMNALYKSDPSAYADLHLNYSKGVLYDLKELNEFWKKYQGPIERTTERINDRYLKANKQEDGVQSYGRMVDLLIAEQNMH